MNSNINSALVGNPVSRLFLCLCPVVAAAATGADGLALGLTMLFVILLSALVLTILKKPLEGSARIPATILIVCLFTGIAQMILSAVSPLLSDELDVFVPLCAVGGMLALIPECPCCPAARGLKSGLAALVMLVLVGVIREVLGYGAFFGCKLGNCVLTIARFPAAAFILLGVLTGIVAAICGCKKEEA